MNDFLSSMLIVTPVGVFTYIVGWWMGYRTAVHEGDEE